MRKLAEFVRKYALAVLAPAALILLLLLVSPQTRSWGAVVSLLKQSFAPAILGWGVLYGMQAGNWDFSLGGRIVLVAILGGNIASSAHLGVVGFVVLCMVFSMICAILVGGAYWVLKIPTMIASIGIMLIFESLTRIIYNGAGTHLDQSMMILGKWPYNFIVFLAAFALASVLSYKRKFGYAVRAVGINATVAKTNGIDPMKTKAIAIVYSGIFVGIYAILNTSISGVASAVAGTMGSMATVFDAMMCVLIGMAIAGKGSVVFAVYSGAIITQLLKMGMTAVGLPTTFNKVVIAVFVVAFMVSSSRRDLIDRFVRRVHRQRKAA